MTKLIPGENDLATQKPELAAQWHSTKNNGLTPKNILLHSNKKVWWRCPEGHEWEAKRNEGVSPRDVSKGTIRTFWWLGKCGHEWPAVIGHRSRGSGCPVCYGRKRKYE